MTFALMSNILLGLLCVGVIVQTRRLMLRLRTVSDGSMQTTVAALDRATAEARTVLEGLRRLLSEDGAAVARNVAAARALQDELGVLIGLADAMAERLVEARSARLDERAAQDEKEEANASRTHADDPTDEETGATPTEGRAGNEPDDKPDAGPDEREAA